MQFIKLQQILFFWCLIPQILLTEGTNKLFTNLQQRLPTPFVLAQTQFGSDIFFSQAEFDYLTDFKPGELVDATSLYAACFYLQQRQLFAQIKVSLIAQPDGRKNLFFNLIGLPILGAIKVSGIMFGKEHYRQLYGLQLGDRFDKQAHRQGVTKILLDLKNHGYLDAKISENLNFNPDTKQVSVELRILPGQQFKIIDFKLDIGLEQNSAGANLDIVKKNISKLLETYFNNQPYTTLFFNQQLRELKKYLFHHGYPASQIEFTLFKNKFTKALKINFNLNLSEAQSYHFTGNYFYHKSQLLDHLMRSGDLVWHLPINLLVKSLTKLYEQSGFWQVFIHGNDLSNSYHFQINEGQRAKITKIKMKGCPKNQAKFMQQRFLKKTLVGKFFEQKKVDQALEKLTAYYISQGYWDFKVIIKRFKILDQHRQQYKLILLVDLGRQRFLKNVQIAHDPHLHLPCMVQKKLKPFLIDDLQYQKAQLKKYFQAKQPNHVTIYPEITEEPGPHQTSWVTVLWQIKFEPSSLAGKVVRQGNAQLKFSQLLQNMPFAPAAVWQKQHFSQAFLRFKNMGAFDNVAIFPGNLNDPFGKRPVLLKLNLDHQIEVKTRFGFQKVSKNFAFKAGTTYKFGLSVLYKNPSEQGDQLRFDADLTKYYRNIVLQYRRPVFIKKPLDFVAKAYANQYDQPIFIGSKNRLYTVLQQGGLVDLGFKNQNLNLDLNTGIESIKVTNISLDYAHAIDFAAQLIGRHVPFWFLEPAILIDYLDDKINPRNGLLTLLTGKTMIALGSQNNYFLKFLLDQSIFVPLFSDSTLAICFRLGHIFTNNFKTLMPIERFYLGGTYTIRSYEPDFAPPLGQAVLNSNQSQADLDHANTLGDCLCEEKLIWLPQGGKSMVNLSFEIRFPLYQSLGGVLFQDLGTLLKPGQNLGQNSLLTATGFGLRYQTPVGPLRFDIGWRPGNFAWFLTIGHAF